MLQVPVTIPVTASSSVSLQHGWEGDMQESSLHLAGKEISVLITNLRVSAQRWRRRWHGASLPFTLQLFRIVDVVLKLYLY